MVDPAQHRQCDRAASPLGGGAQPCASRGYLLELATWLQSHLSESPFALERRNAERRGTAPHGNLQVTDAPREGTPFSFLNSALGYRMTSKQP